MWSVAFSSSLCSLRVCIRRIRKEAGADGLGKLSGKGNLVSAYRIFNMEEAER